MSAFTPPSQNVLSCGSPPVAAVDPVDPLELEELLVVAVGVVVPAAPLVLDEVVGVAVPAAPLELEVVAVGLAMGVEVAADVAVEDEEPVEDEPDEEEPVLGTAPAAGASGSTGVQAVELLLVFVVVLICAKAAKLKTSAAIVATTEAAMIILIFTKTSYIEICEIRIIAWRRQADLDNLPKSPISGSKYINDEAKVIVM